MKIVFDTETTGLPTKSQNWETDYNDYPYLVQLSWKVLGSEEVKDYIIKPEGYEIPEAAVAVHGITTEIALEKGHFVENVIREFIDDCSQAEKIIGHNVYFDTSIIKANIKRLAEKSPAFPEGYVEKSILALDKGKRIDTMMKTISFCSIPFPNGKGKKYPTLKELYAKLFDGEEFNAHNSKDDVNACERCYNELINIGIIEETTTKEGEE
jgi:DNA polymerase-3 subunit alpha